ncbi:hypothetical protein FOBRF1_012780 [Fusarium oxysporum]
MHRSPSVERLSKAEPGTSEQPQYSSNNFSTWLNLPDERSAYIQSYVTNNYQVTPDNSSAYVPYSITNYQNSPPPKAQLLGYPPPLPAPPAPSAARNTFITLRSLPQRQLDNYKVIDHVDDVLRKSRRPSTQEITYTPSYVTDYYQVTPDNSSAYIPCSITNYQTSPPPKAQLLDSPPSLPAPPAPSAAYGPPPAPPYPVYESHLRNNPAPRLRVYKPGPRQRVSIACRACRYCRRRRIRCSGRPDAIGAFIPVNAMPGPTSEGGSVYDPISQSPCIPVPSPSRQVGSPGTYTQQSQQSGQPLKTQVAYAGVNTTSQQPFNPRIDLKTPAQTLQTELGHRDDQSETYGPSFSFHRLQQALESQNDASDPYQHSLIQDLKLLESFAPGALAKSLAIRQDLERQINLIGQKSGDDVRSKLEEETKVLQESSTELPDASGLRLRARAPSSSPTVSSDVDVVSVSEDSEGTCQLDRNTQGFRIFGRVFRRLAVLGQQDVMARGESSGSSSKGKQVAQGGSSSSSGTRDGTSSTRGRKNQRQDDDHGDEGRDKRNEPPQKRGKTSQSQCEGRSQFLACPYWKLDPERYWDCFMKKNDTIAHLKQHLTRRHTPKYYCQICYETFKDFDPFDSHVLRRSCTRGPSAKLEGISQQQKNQLSLKSKGSVEQQWYTVWSILFPDIDPPSTIFIHSTQSEDFCRMQEFAQREGVAIMLEELDSSGLVIRPDASSQQLQSTVQRAMVSIFRNYWNRREPNFEQAEEPNLSHGSGSAPGTSLQQQSTLESQIRQGDPILIDLNRTIADDTDNSVLHRLDRSSSSTWPQLPTVTPWLSREAVQDHIERGPWAPTFLEEPALGETSTRNDLAFSLESSGMLDLDALLRDVINTEA